MRMRSAVLAGLWSTLLLGSPLVVMGQPILPPDPAPGNQPGPANQPDRPAPQPGQQQPPSADEIPVFQPEPTDSFVLVERDAEGKLLPLTEPLGDAAGRRVPLSEEDAQKVLDVIALRREMLDASVIRRFGEALDLVRAGGLEPRTVWESVNDVALGQQIGRFRAPMVSYTRRGTLLNDPDIRSWMTLDDLKEFGRIYRGWQASWIAQEQAELRRLSDEGAELDPTLLMPGTLDSVREALEFETEVRRALFRQYRAGEEGFFDDVRALELTPEQASEIDRIQSVDDVDDLTQFLRVATALTDAQNRALITRRNPERWEEMLLPPALTEAPEGLQFEYPQVEASGPDSILVRYDPDGRLARLETDSDLAALRALDLPEATRAEVERIVAEREAIFDEIIIDLAGQVHWVCATGDVEAMSPVDILINDDQIGAPIRGLGALMRNYYMRGDLLHDGAIREALSEAQHATLQRVHTAYTDAWLAQCRAQVAAGKAAGLEFNEAAIKDGNLIQILRMKDFMRKARQRIADEARATEDDLPQTLRAELPEEAVAPLEPQLARFDEAAGPERIELFWDMMIALTPEQAVRVIEARRPDAAALDTSRREPAERTDG